MIFVIFLIVIFIILDNNISGWNEKNKDNYFCENGRRINLTKYYTKASQRGCKDSFCQYEDKVDGKLYCKYYKEKIQPRDVCPIFVEHDFAGIMAAMIERQMKGEELYFDDEE